MSLDQHMRLARVGQGERCDACETFYGDSGPCDRGMPSCSPHRPAIEAYRAKEAKRVAAYRAARRENEVA